MNKNEARARFFEVKKQLTDLLSLAKAENRALTAEEEAKKTQLRAELDECQILMQIDAAQQLAEAGRSAGQAEQKRAAALNFAERLVTLMATPGGRLDVNVRDYAGNDKASVEPDTALTIGEIIEPLEKGMILDRLGCRIQTGLTGDWQYPVLSAVEATIAGETAEIEDSKIDMDKINPTPHRLALSILVTRTALNATNDRLRDIVLTQIVEGLRRTLNKWMFKRTAVASGVNGLFVSPGTSVEMAVAGAPTYAEILGLKAAVDSTGVRPDDTAAYVMTNAMRAVLEATPKGANAAAGMICENDRINGVPVYVTEYAPKNAVEFGYFSYALVGQFGEMDIVVDPYTKATSNSVRFVLNTDFDIKAARAEAFGILKSANASGSN